jgi:predicted transcriptional regulator
MNLQGAVSDFPQGGELGVVGDDFPLPEGVRRRAGGRRSAEGRSREDPTHEFMNSNSAKDGTAEAGAAVRSRWDFLTNHAHVLVCIANDPGIRLRDIATAVGITERSAHKILSELVDDGYAARERRGRRNHYTVKLDLPLRHPLLREREVGDLLEVLLNRTGA